MWREMHDSRISRQILSGEKPGCGMKIQPLSRQRVSGQETLQLQVVSRNTATPRPGPLAFLFAECVVVTARGAPSDDEISMPYVCG